jgi:hypothetical protein
MRRLLMIAVVAVFGSLLFVPAAFAGNPHFVGTTQITREGDSLTATGKLAGLGNEDQVEVQLTATAQCVNPGSKKPKAANKQSLAAAGTFPVQNGKADFTLTVTATFQPSCSPPMTVEFTNVVVTDLTHGISQSIPGTF